jgi:Domain of unknown function (DUF4412)
MRVLLCATTAMALLFAADAFAGIVVTQQRETRTDAGVRKSEETLMVQGHAQKLVTPDRVVITDLDKGMTYEIQPRHKTYYEMTIPPTGVASSQLKLTATKVAYKRTGKTRTVNGYKCEEYTGIGRSRLATFTIRQCISHTAPGAKEVSAFEKLLNAKLKGSAEGSTGDVPIGLAIQSTSTLRPEDINPPAGSTPQEAALLKQANAGKRPVSTVVTVTKIEEKKLPPDTFQIPSGFTQRQFILPRTINR